MKRKLGWFLILAIIGGTLVALLVPKRTMRNLYNYVRYVISSKAEARTTEPVIAAFDRESGEFKLTSNAFQYINYRILNSDLQRSNELEKIKKGTSLFVTVDMWNNNISGNPLESIINGKYDNVINKFCTEFSGTKQPVFIRWNPEMEVNTEIHPWQQQSPVLYNKAFYYFAAQCRKLIPGVKIVWSTAGYPGVLDYFPEEEDFIDYVSVTLGSKSERSTNAFPGYESASEEIIKKIHRMRFIDKPVLVLAKNKVANGDSLHTALIKAQAYLKENSTAVFQTVKALEENVAEKEADEGVRIGTYDPDQKLRQIKEISTEHIFIDWHNIQDGSYESQIREIINRKHDIIVTLEPWRESKAKPDSNVLISIVDGRYDKYLNTLFNNLSETGRTVYLRWIHEMEIPVTRYPWQSQPPVNYIKAFRYLATFRKPGNKNIKFVWGPAGDRGLQDFWPGSDVVDYISIAIYGLPDKNITDYKKQESFKTIFNRKNNRMRFFNKPIFITEFGIKGPEDFQRQWLVAAAETIKANPQVKGVCYFNMVDTPKAWGDIEAPVWKISPKAYQIFVNALQQNTESIAAVHN
jgi:beta-mannanase